jgi:hypothetical protein
MDKKLNIYSWNVLNPNININYMTWKNSCNKFCAKQLAKIDNLRFMSYRKNAIISIINYWLNKNTNVIICLQEVCNQLLQQIRKLENVSFHHTKLINDNCQVTIIKGFTSSEKKIALNINNKEQYALKVILDDIIEINNLHLHWSWNKDHISKAGHIIDASLKKEYIVICGDMNKTFTTIQPFLDEFNCLLLDDEVKGYTGINTETGNKDIIDHIFLSANVHNRSDLKIITNVKKYQIMYNIEKIIKHYQGKWTSEKWIKVRKNKDISDHKPVKVTIKIEK